MGKREYGSAGKDRQISDRLKLTSEKVADDYAKSNDVLSLSLAFGNYFGLGIGYHMVHDTESFKRVGDKGNRVVDKLVTLTGSSRDKVLEDLFGQISGAASEAEKMTGKKYKGRTLSAIVGFAGALGGLALLSHNITGNVIANVGTQSSNLIGALLFIAGIWGIFIFSRAK